MIYGFNPGAGTPDLTIKAWRGTWHSSISYSEGDVCEMTGNLFIAKKPSLGKQPRSAQGFEVWSPMGGLPPSVEPEPFTLADVPLDDYVHLDMLTEFGGVDDFGGMVPKLTFEGLLDPAMIPPLDDLYVPVNKTTYAGGFPAYNGYVPQLDATGRLDQSMIPQFLTLGDIYITSKSDGTQNSVLSLFGWVTGYGGGADNRPTTIFKQALPKSALIMAIQGNTIKTQTVAAGATQFKWDTAFAEPAHTIVCVIRFT